MNQVSPAAAVMIPVVMNNNQGQQKDKEKQRNH